MKILEENKYAIFLKLLGIGYLLIGFSIIFTIEEKNMLSVSIGMAFAIVFIGIGEIISLLDKIYKEMKNNGFIRNNKK